MIAVPHYVSPNEYLAIDRDSTVRHEYRRGLVYAMAGGSTAHARIAVNLVSLLNPRLRGTPCRLYNGDVKVNYQDQFYYYPDASVSCDPRDRQDPMVQRHSKLICEVLSDSTAAFDRGEKFLDYQKLESLEEYVLISQDTQQVECRRRQADGRWETQVYRAGDRVVLASLDFEFDLGELYVDID